MQQTAMAHYQGEGAPTCFGNGVRGGVPPSPPGILLAQGRFCNRLFISVSYHFLLKMVRGAPP